MRSVMEKRGAEVEFGEGAVVDVRRASRTWDPVEERESEIVGSKSKEEPEKRRALISLRRKGMSLLGRRADWIMWEVVVYIDSARRVCDGNASREF